MKPLTTAQARKMGILPQKPKRSKADKEAARKKKEAEQADFQRMVSRWDLPVPVPEFEFHPVRKWKFDWLFRKLGMQAGVALEIEGSPYAGKPCPRCRMRPGGRHNRGKGFIDDLRKYDEAAIMGYLVIRATWDMVNSGEAFEMVRRAMGL